MDLFVSSGSTGTKVSCTMDIFFKQDKGDPDGGKSLLVNKKIKSIYEVDKPCSVIKKRPKKRLLKFVDPGELSNVLKGQPNGLSLKPTGLINKQVYSFDNNKLVTEEEMFLAGNVLCGKQSSDYDFGIIWNNIRFWDNMESNVGEKLWNAILILGVISPIFEKGYKKKIDEMERVDKKRKKGGKVNTQHFVVIIGSLNVRGAGILVKR